MPTIALTRCGQYPTILRTLCTAVLWAWSATALAQVPIALPWCITEADPSVPDKPPAGTYSLAPFDVSHIVFRGDFADTPAVAEQRKSAVGEMFQSSLAAWLSQLEVKPVASVADATGLVITGELLLVDAGNAKARMLSPVKGPGITASAGVVVQIFDASAPDKVLYESYVLVADENSPTYVTPTMLTESLPKGILKALKKPSKGKRKPALADAVAQLPAERDATYAADPGEPAAEPSEAEAKPSEPAEQ